MIYKNKSIWYTSQGLIKIPMDHSLCEFVCTVILNIFHIYKPVHIANGSPLDKKRLKDVFSTVYFVIIVPISMK